MYFSAKHIDVKQHQDNAGFIQDSKISKLILCDGIGSFKDSRKVANASVETFIHKNIQSIGQLILHPKMDKKEFTDIVGGTTIIMALNKVKTNQVKIEYIGNGGVIHCFGNFADTRITEMPYRYTDIMLPHIDPDDALTRHLSNDSGKSEHIAGKIELDLNYLQGDILLFFTDGIASLEDKVIIQDEEGRFWRCEVPAIQYILQELNDFLKGASLPNFNDQLKHFNITVLEKLKEGKYLEDDASLGIIITENVLKYYQRNNDSIP